MNKLFWQSYRNGYLKKNLSKMKEFKSLKDAGVDLQKVYDETESLHEYDDTVTFLIAGEKSRDDYYDAISPLRNMEKVKVPVLVYHAMDDNIMTVAGWNRTEINDNPNLLSVYTQRGGHCGTFEEVHKSDQWIIKPVYDFLSFFLRENNDS